jgi:hypothetical protein
MTLLQGIYRIELELAGQHEKLEVKQQDNNTCLDVNLSPIRIAGPYGRAHALPGSSWCSMRSIQQLTGDSIRKRHNSLWKMVERPEHEERADGV